jgi:anthranilate phosphoribosyltransferase
LYNYIYQQTDKNYTIIYSLDGYDEISLTSEYKLISNMEEDLVDPEKAGFPRLTGADVAGGSTVTESVKIFLDILDGNGTEAQNAVVIANSGYALKKLHPQKNIRECFSIAGESLKSGMAKKMMKKLLEA